MALTLVSRCDATWPTSWPVSLTGVVVGIISAAPAGTAGVTSFGAGFGLAAFGTSPFGG